MPDFKSCIKFHAGKESTESPFEQTIFLDFSGKAKLEKKKIKKFPFLPKEIFSGIFFFNYYYLLLFESSDSATHTTYIIWTPIGIYKFRLLEMLGFFF